MYPTVSSFCRKPGGQGILVDVAQRCQIWPPSRSSDLATDRYDPTIQTKVSPRCVSSIVLVSLFLRSRAARDPGRRPGTRSRGRRVQFSRRTRCHKVGIERLCQMSRFVHVDQDASTLFACLRQALLFGMPDQGRYQARLNPVRMAIADRLRRDFNVPVRADLYDQRGTTRKDPSSV